MFTVTIQTTNEAFEDDSIGQVCQILRTLAKTLSPGHISGPVRDSNGNTVGTFAFTYDDEPVAP